MMNSSKLTVALAESGFVLKGLTILLPALIFMGYSLRSIVSYNFEIVLLLSMLILGGVMLYRKQVVWNSSLVTFSAIALLYLVSVASTSLLLHGTSEIASHKINILLMIIGFIALTWLLYVVRPTIDYFWYFLLIACIVMLVWAGLEFYHQGEAILNGTLRLGDLYSNPIKFGVFMNAIFILMLGGVLWAYQKHPAVMVVWLVLLLMSLLAVIFAQSRTAWIGWPEAIIGWGAYYLFILLKSNKSKKLKYSLAALPVVLVLALFSFENVSKVFETRYEATVDNIDQYVNKGNHSSSLGIRFMMYETAVDMVMEKPVFGIGAEAFQNKFKERTADKIRERFGDDVEGYKHSHVHNQFLMTWVQYGVLPTLILIVFFIYLLQFFVKGVRVSSYADKPVFIAGLVFTVASLLSFLPESPLEYSSYSAHYLLFFSLIFVYGVLVEESAKERSSQIT